MFWYNTRIIQNSSNPADPVTVLCRPHHDTKFVCNTLEKFRNTESGQLCVADKVTQQVDYRHYCLRRCHESKQDERKSVRQEMHELVRLLLQFRSTAAKHGLGREAMFTRQHLALLRESIDTLAEGGKYGLKLNLDAIIMRNLNSLKGLHSEVV